MGLGLQWFHALQRAGTEKWVQETAPSLQFCMVLLFTLRLFVPHGSLLPRYPLEWLRDTFWEIGNPLHQSEAWQEDLLWKLFGKAPMSLFGDDFQLNPVPMGPAAE